MNIILYLLFSTIAPIVKLTNAQLLAFTSFPTAVVAGKPYTITYTGGTTSVEVILRKGPSNNFTIRTILTTSPNGAGSFVWTPDTSLRNAKDYALQINSGSSTNYAGPITLTGGSEGDVSPSSSATSSTPSSTTTSIRSSTSSASTSGTSTSPQSSSTSSGPTSSPTTPPAVSQSSGLSSVTSPPSSSSSSAASSGLSPTTKVGLGVGIGLGIPLLAVIAGGFALLFIRERRKRQRAEALVGIGGPGAAVAEKAELEASTFHGQEPDGIPNQYPPESTPHYSELDSTAMRHGASQAPGASQTGHGYVDNVPTTERVELKA